MRGGELLNAAEAYGVTNLYRGLLGVSKDKVLFENTRHIRIVLNDGYGFFKDYREKLQSALEAGCTVHVMLLRPDTVSLPAVADKSAKTT